MAVRYNYSFDRCHICYSAGKYVLSMIDIINLSTGEMDELIKTNLEWTFIGVLFDQSGAGNSSPPRGRDQLDVSNLFS